jgi:hypothetical protein
MLDACCPLPDAPMDDSAKKRCFRMCKRQAEFESNGIEALKSDFAIMHSPLEGVTKL